MRAIIAASATDISKASCCFYTLYPTVLPENPIILDRWGRNINRTTIGPMEEGDDVILSCRVIGGKYLFKFFHPSFVLHPSAVPTNPERCKHVRCSFLITLGMINKSLEDWRKFNFSTRSHWRRMRVYSCWNLKEIGNSSKGWGNFVWEDELRNPLNC